MGIVLGDFVLIETVDAKTIFFFNLVSFQTCHSVYTVYSVTYDTQKECHGGYFFQSEIRRRFLTFWFVPHTKLFVLGHLTIIRLKKNTVSSFIHLKPVHDFFFCEMQTKIF